MTRPTTIPVLVANHDPRFTHATHAFANTGCRCPRDAHPIRNGWPTGALLAVIHHRIDCPDHPDRRRIACPYAGCEPRLLVLPDRGRKSAPPSRKW